MQNNIAETKFIIALVYSRMRSSHCATLIDAIVQVIREAHFPDSVMIWEIICRVLTSVGIEYEGQSRARRRIADTFSRVNSHVSMWARRTAAKSRGWSSSSVARARCWPRFCVLCCMAAKMRAFSRFGTRPNLTAGMIKESGVGG